MSARWQADWSRDVASFAPMGEPFPIIPVGGIPFQATDLDRATSWLQVVAKQRHPVSVRLANAYCVALSTSDEDYADLMRSSGINFPDGAPVVWFMRRRKGERDLGTSPGRVRGPSFFEMSLAKGQSVNTRNFFLGATAETLDELLLATARKFPSAIVAGSYSPPFSPVTDAYLEECARRIREASPDIVWVGLGTPKQDFVSDQLSKMTGLPCVGVGAAFDFTAGTISEAPGWIQRSGFEWLYRLCTEPRRLWRRYLFGNVRFLQAAMTKQKGLVPSATQERE